MNTKLQSQLLSAILVLVATTAPIVPTYAASTPVHTTAISANAVVTNDSALIDTITALLKDGKVTEAMTAVDQAISANSSNATAYLCKGMILYVDKADNAKVLEQLNMAVSLAPNYGDALYTRGCVLREMNNLPAAVQDFDAVIALDNSDTDAMQASTEIKTSLKDWKGLIANFNIQIQNNQSNASAYFNRAYCEYMIGQNDQAIADLKQAQTLFLAANDAAGAKAAGDAISQVQQTT